MSAGLPVTAWVGAPVGWMETVEVVDGELVRRRVGGNRHRVLAAKAARAFESRWAAVAVSPGNWVTEAAGDGAIVAGRVLDVLVAGAEVLSSEVYRGVPLAGVEVLLDDEPRSERDRRWEEYRRAGLPLLVGVAVDEVDRADWYRNDGDAWRPCPAEFSLTE